MDEDTRQRGDLMRHELPSLRSHTAFTSRVSHVSATITLQRLRLAMRPLRDLFFFILAVATISILITYNLNWYVPRIQRIDGDSDDVFKEGDPSNLKHILYSDTDLVPILDIQRDLVSDDEQNRSLDTEGDAISDNDRHRQLKADTYRDLELNTNRDLAENSHDLQHNARNPGAIKYDAAIEFNNHDIIGINGDLHQQTLPHHTERHVLNTDSKNKQSESRNGQEGKSTFLGSAGYINTATERRRVMEGLASPVTREAAWSEGDMKYLADKLLKIEPTQRDTTITLRAVLHTSDDITDGMWGSGLFRHNINIIQSSQVVIESATSGSHEEEIPPAPDWLLHICITANQTNRSSPCSQQFTGMLHPHEAVNRIPGIERMLATHKVCASHDPRQMSQATLETPWRCFRLPDQASDVLLMAVDYPRAIWWIDNVSGSGTSVVLPSQDTHSLLQHVTSARHPAAALLLINPLLVTGRVFTSRLYVLVTSFSPLRAYIHKEGHVHFHRSDTLPQTKEEESEMWDIRRLSEHLALIYNDSVAKLVFRNAAIAITQAIATPEQDFCDTQCTRCFQILACDIIFNSTFHPYVVKMLRVDEAGQQPMQFIIEDAISMVMASRALVPKNTQIFRLLGIRTDVEDAACCSKTKICLRRHELSYLVAWRLELAVRGGYQMLYPTDDPEVPGTLMHLNKDMCSLSREATSMLHYIARRWNVLDTETQTISYTEMPREPSTNQSALHCSDDPSDMPYLEWLHTLPALTVSPAFNASINEYYANVDYETHMVQVWGVARSCYCQAHMDDKYGTQRPSNYPLGLGPNQIKVVVVDKTHTALWVINTYILHVFRQQHPAMPFPPAAHQVCYLLQDCGLRYRSEEPCGPQPVSTTLTWQQYEETLTTLPPCQGGHAPGAWLLPCNNCMQHHTCHWDKIKWQPHRCNHTPLQRDKLKECLAGKQMLFIGDSTNRGIMHYVTEQVNGSLTQWDKTHNIKLYDNVNHGRTNLSFAYYPQFWLPSSQRPDFASALTELIDRMSSLQNNKKTILVVGGVHWLASHHLNVIAATLRRAGLQSIEVVVKTLGAGFHQKVDGLHCLTLKEQQKLAIHNMGLVEFSLARGFKVIDSFNMTMARYLDFLQGKCACHFHRVRDMLPSFTQYLHSTAQQGDGKPVDLPIQHHVEGDINALYSEMFLSTVCGQI